jgi:signal transduction histidine kinase
VDAPRSTDVSEHVARDVVRRVVAAQELERRRLARELHDEAAQSLASILLGLRDLDRTLEHEDSRAAVARIRELAADTLADVRRLAVELRPKALDDFGLVPALDQLARTFSDDTGLRVDVISELDGERLSEEARITLYRSLQEALTNVAKHAQARAVSIVLRRRDTSVVALVEDDGRGFDLTGPTEGFGLQDLRERLALVGGRLTIESGPGAGTTLVVEVPDAGDAPPPLP